MDEHVESSVRADDTEISLFQVIQALIGHWHWLIGCILLSFLLSVGVAFLSTPVYRSEVVITEVSSSRSSQPGALLGQLSGIAGLAGIDIGAFEGNMSEARGVLQSRILVEEFIRRTDLLPTIFHDKWDAQAQSWNTDPESTPTLWLGTKKFSEEIRSMRSDPTTGLITLVIEWTDPKVAAQWANDLVALANRIIRNRVIATAETNIEFLEAQISETNVVEMQSVLYNLIATETQTLMLANARPEYAFVVVDPAVVAERPVRPQVALVIVLGTALGGLVGLLLIFLVQFSQNYRRYRHTDD